MFRTLIAAALLAVVAGCASAPSAQPTHYWESSKADDNRYRADNVSCQKSAPDGATAAAFEPGSPSFEQYRDCMVNRGYVLRQY
jgi:hypothetical protein